MLRDMKKNLKIGIILALVVFLGIIFISNDVKMKNANISGYAFLEEISQCDIIYNFNMMTGKMTPEFNEDCLKNATSHLREISFEPGEKGEKFLLESEEYLGCSYINNLKGSEAFRNCIEEILPKLREKYPEVVEE